MVNLPEDAFFKGLVAVAVLFAGGSLVTSAATYKAVSKRPMPTPLVVEATMAPTPMPSLTASPSAVPVLRLVPVRK